MEYALPFFFGDYKVSNFHLIQGKIERATKDSCGFDLFYAGKDTFWLSPGDRISLPTGVKTKFDGNLQVILKEKSGNWQKHGLAVHAGVIDGDYPDEWMVCVKNEGKMNIQIDPGMKIAQAIIVEKPQIQFWCDENAQFVHKNDTRTGGFGSTGGDLRQTVGVEKASITDRLP